MTEEKLRTVWKFPIPQEAQFEIALPGGGYPIHVAEQHDLPYLWAVCTPGEPTSTFQCRVVGTGYAEVPPLDGRWEYCGTLMMLGGNLVLHVFWNGLGR